MNSDNIISMRKLITSTNLKINYLQYTNKRDGFVANINRRAAAKNSKKYLGCQRCFAVSADRFQGHIHNKKGSFFYGSGKKNNLLEYKNLKKFKGATKVLMKKLKISPNPNIFSKKKFVKTMHRKRFDYPDCGDIGIYPLKPLHIETSYRLMISLFLFSPQKLSLLSPFWEKTSL